MQSVQEQYAMGNTCFGCGPSNAQGLRIRSFVEGDALVCDWLPAPHHLAFPGVLNGGICGALLDCHSNWAACVHLMKKLGAASPPCTVTSEFAVKLRRPTPMDRTLHLVARVVESADDRAIVEATIAADGRITASCTGTFIAVKEGHPAFHRW